jgi:endoribonuclease Dicer
VLSLSKLVGDAYLKYLSSIYLFVTNPTLHEGALHIARQRIISNRSLLRNADRSGLPQYIQSKPFTSKAWQPPNFKLYRAPRPAIPKETTAGNEPDADDVNLDSIPENPLFCPENENTINSNHADDLPSFEQADDALTNDEGKADLRKEESVKSPSKPLVEKGGKRNIDEANVQFLGDKVSSS